MAGEGLAGAGRRLAPYAATGGRGRLIKEEEDPHRGPYQRDRDRIIHSTAFRRLTYKTQVFLFHEGDHYRTRLTHSLEVAQIARNIARQLALEEDLAEAVALAHDLGHPPFGHAGERALAAVMAEHGGFDHNAQSLRIVTELERKYAAFDGLNLTADTLEGIAKHNGPLLGPHASHRDPTGMVAAFNERFDMGLDIFASAEAQVAALADDIAYNNHDIDDGLRAGLIGIGDLRDVRLPARALLMVEEAYGPIEGNRTIYEVNRRMISAMVADIASQSRRRIGAANPASCDDIRRAPEPLIAFSPGLEEEIAELKTFLKDSIYRHHKVMAVMD
ncbi:MAG: deoxyguanosinetriphosphate triphosphohydrolase, partial [Hyphomicrobiaceae bacterium]